MIRSCVYNDTIEPRAMRLVTGKKRAAKQFEGDMIREAFVQEAGEEEAAYSTAMSLFTMLRDDGETQRMLDAANATQAPVEKATFTLESGTRVTISMGPVVEAVAQPMVEAAAKLGVEELVQKAVEVAVEQAMAIMGKAAVAPAADPAGDSMVEAGLDEVVSLIQDFTAHVNALPVAEPEDLDDLWGLVETSEELSSSEFMRRQLGLAA